MAIHLVRDGAGGRGRRGTYRALGNTRLGTPEATEASVDGRRSVWPAGGEWPVSLRLACPQGRPPEAFVCVSLSASTAAARRPEVAGCGARVSHSHVSSFALHVNLAAIALSSSSPPTDRPQSAHARPLFSPEPSTVASSGAPGPSLSPRPAPPPTAPRALSFADPTSDHPNSN